MRAPVVDNSAQLALLLISNKCAATVKTQSAEAVVVVDRVVWISKKVCRTQNKIKV